MKNTVVVFARAPRLGTVKRRLARDLGARSALRFHLATMTTLLRRLAADRRFRTVLAVTPGGARFASGFSGPRLDQGRGDIGKRMDRVFRRFRRGRVAIIGTDIPHAGASDIVAAFCALGRAAAVFGPATDGGYWLVGMGPRRPANPFAGVRWSSEYALADTLRNFRAHGIAFLRLLQDVDNAEDFRGLSQNRPNLVATHGTVIDTLDREEASNGRIGMVARRGDLPDLPPQLFRQ